jgi:hypothetical protein
MPSTNLYRYSGLALLWGAVLGIIGNVVTNVLFPNSDPGQAQSSLVVVVTLVSLIGQVLLLMGLAGIAARQGSQTGRLGLSGFALTFAGGLMFTSFSVMSLVIFPSLAQAAPSFFAANAPPPPAMLAFFLIASILFGVGGLLLGIAVMRGGVLPRTAGLLVLVGAVLNAAAFPLNGLLSTIVSTVAFVVFAAGIGWIGYVMSSERRVAARLA